MDGHGSGPHRHQPPDISGFRLGEEPKAAQVLMSFKVESLQVT